MREKDLPFDRTKHVCYTKNAKKCVLKLLRRYYDEPTAAELWEKIQLQFCEYLKDEPALAGLKITTSIYDPILIFAWYAVAPDKPPIEEIQQDVYNCMMSSFTVLGRIVNLNRKGDNRLAGYFRKPMTSVWMRSKDSRRPSVWADALMTRKMASSATALPSARTRNLPSATTWRTCCPSCATATILPCRRCMPRSSAKGHAAQARAATTVSSAIRIRWRRSMNW